MKFQLNRYSRPQSFRSPNDFARYAERQAEKFGALKQDDPRSYEWWALKLENHWKNAAASSRQDGATENSIQQSMQAHPTFLFDSALTRVLRLMSAQGRSTAAQEIVPFLTGGRDGHNGAQLNVAHMTAHAEFSAATSLDSQVKRDSLLSIEDQIEAYQDRLNSMLEADFEEVQKARSEFEALLKGAREQHDDLHRKAKGLIAQSVGEWRETHNSYVEQLATETAVELWSNRAIKHEFRYKSFRKWAVGFGLVGLLLAFVWIFGGFAIARLVFEGDQTAQIASYTAGSLALFTIFVWGLRVLVRSMMSEDHLSTGASARSALAHTYLALIKEQAATPEDRTIILASLFAPVSDGLVKDDGMPALSPAALAAQMLTNPRS